MVNSYPVGRPGHALVMQANLSYSPNDKCCSSGDCGPIWLTPRTISGQLQDMVFKGKSVQGTRPQNILDTRLQQCHHYPDNTAMPTVNHSINSEGIEAPRVRMIR